MFSERECIIKHVIPRLSTWYEKQRLRIRVLACDMRWGVPNDPTTRRTVEACMRAIDKCKAENEMPYFVALIGDRYGWVPPESGEDALPADMRAR